jgi:N-acetylmuramoyl-L-alanine amidase
MKINSILILFLLVFLATFFQVGSEALANPPKKPALLLEEADHCRKSLYGSAKKKKYRHNWSNCIRLYEKITNRYPKSDEAPWALYHSAGLFTWLYTYSGKFKDLDQALLLYRRLTDTYEDHRLSDDAQYKIGEIFYKYKKDPTHAYVEFLKVDIKYPSGDMRPKAKKMLDQLAVVLSEKDNDQDLAGEKRTSIAVKDIRHWSTPNYTRVVIDLEGPVKYKHHLLKADPDRRKPRRLYLDLENSHVTAQVESPVSIKDGLLQRARAGQYNEDTVRVVLDAESIEGYKVFHLHDPFRIVMDVRRTEEMNAGDAPNLTSERTVRKGVRRAEDSQDSMSLAIQLGLNVKKIVIDPGHGGKDPGCTARGGVKEKAIVLSIARILKEKIKEKIGCEAFLTRDSDVFLPLERRTAIANMKKADLFISLHINAHRNRKISGLETYFLNMAMDERSVMVAARENATSEKNISDLQAILNDLMLNTKITESSRLAHDVQKGMVSSVRRTYKKARSLGVKQAPFYVLIGAQMPAVLVETGFLTNRTDRKRLLSKKYQESVAEGICLGIKSYIESIDQKYKGG